MTNISIKMIWDDYNKIKLSLKFSKMKKIETKVLQDINNLGFSLMDHNDI